MHKESHFDFGLIISHHIGKSTESSSNSYTSPYEVHEVGNVEVDILKEKSLSSTSIHSPFQLDNYNFAHIFIFRYLAQEIDHKRSLDPSSYEVCTNF